jgi:hypothetical protein
MNYIVARRWPNGSLCPYAYGGQVFDAETLEEAEAMRDFIRGQADNQEYEVYLLPPGRKKSKRYSEKDIKEFVDWFYSVYGNMMSKLANE